MSNNISKAHSVKNQVSSTLIDLLRRNSFDKGNQLAYTFLVDGGAEKIDLTYGELDRRSRAIGASLQLAGATGERVLLLYPPGVEFITAFLGCLYAGAIAVPAYPPRPNRSDLRLQKIIADTQAAVALTTKIALSRVDRAFGEASYMKNLRWLATDEIVRESEQKWREPSINGDTLAMIQYTSGSTSAPKGVMISHSNLLSNERMIQEAFHQTEESIIVGWLPLYHDMGLIGNVFQPLFLGARCVLMSPTAFLQKPLRWLQAISDYRATTSGGPNFAYDLCVRKISPDERARLDLSSWTVAFNGAEPIFHKTMERFAATFASCGFRRESFYPCFGLAEATLLVSAGPNQTQLAIDEEAVEPNHLITSTANDGKRIMVGCGRALPDERVVIVDPESLTPCPAEKVGEIWVSGPNIARGYWNRDQETEQTFGAYMAGSGEGPFLRTGDLGYIVNDELFVAGRLKDLIIIRGRNHYPQDLELTVRHAHPALEAGSCAAFSIDRADEERLVIVQELSRGVRNPSSLIEIIRESVAREHEVQTHAIVLIDKGSMPKTTSGKIQRYECRNEYQAGKLATIVEWHENVGPEAELINIPSINKSITIDAIAIEAIKTSILAFLAAKLGLDVKQIDVNKPLLSCGIDSLTAMELSHHLESKFGVALASASLLEDVSIAQLARKATEQIKEASDGLRPSVVPVTREATEHPLSYGQRSLWFLHALAPLTGVYNVPSAMRIRSALDSGALRRALQKIVDRHDTLRTTFISREGEPRQRVSQELEVLLPETDASGWSDEFLDDYLAIEAHRPFNLEQGPLLRVSLLTRSPQDHILLVVAHHLVVDLWSMGVLIHELGLFYRAETGSAINPPDPLPVQYIDYVYWQTESLAGPEEDRLWSYWRRKLAGDLGTLDLPTDQPRPAHQTFRGDSQSICLSMDLTQSLKLLGQNHKATLYVTLQAIFHVLLHRYTAQEGILIGSPVAGRSAAELAGLIGYFVNPVILRADLSGNPSFCIFLERVREMTSDAFAHQDYPFALLVERFQPTRDPSRSPLFQVMFALHKAPSFGEEFLVSRALVEGASFKCGGLSAESVALRRLTSRFDLNLSVVETEEGLKGFIEYNPDLFDEWRIRRMAEHFRTLAGAVTADPKQRIGEIDLLNEAERQQILVEWNKTEREYCPSLSVHEMIREQAWRRAEAVAVRSEQGELSYRELDRRANKLARYLGRKGIGREDVVGICADRSAAMVIAMLGVLKAGAAYLPIDGDYPEERIRYMLEDAGVKVLLTQGGAGRRVEAGKLAPKALDLESRWEEIDKETEDDPEVKVEGDNLAYVIYTSGSSGRPKGTLVRHHSLANSTQARSHYYIEPVLNFLLISPFGFDSSVAGIYWTLCQGGTLVLPSQGGERDPALLARLIAENRISHLLCLPTLYSLLLTETEPGQIDSLKCVIVAGEACPSGVIERHSALLTGVELFNEYGPTEGTVWSSVYGDCVKLSRVPAPIGKPIANAQMYILTGELEPTPIGARGEIYISGAGLARGYLGQPGLTAERFIPNRFGREGGERLYRTGDVGRYLSDGNIEFAGRADEQVKVRGYRIELGEIEAALNEHRAVRQSVVVARENERGDKRLVGYVVGEEASAAELKTRLRRRLPEYMVPETIVILEEMPLTANGKIDRKRLLSMKDAGRQVAREYVAPQTSVEGILAGIFEEILKLDRVGRHDNFYEIGGHSLLAIQIVSRVRNAFQVEIGVRSIFEEPTIKGLGRKIEEAMRAANKVEATPPVIIPRKSQRGVKLPLSFAQQRLWFLDRLEGTSAEYNMPTAHRLYGDLNREVLEKTINMIIERHESLRTRFAEEDGEPVQIIEPELRIEAPLEDLSGLDEERRWKRVMAAWRQEGSAPFDLTRGPTLRMKLLKLGEQDHILLRTMHHIVYDRWSEAIFNREFTSIYEALLEGRENPLPPLAVQYADFALWQRQWLGEEALREGLAYWREQLAGIPKRMELPADMARPATRTFEAEVCLLRVSAEQAAGLKRLGQSRQATLYMTLLAAFGVLLGRYSGQDDIVIGSPIANRQAAQLEDLIGFFVNTLVMRVRMKPEMRFPELLGEVRRTALEAYQHQDVPFERLVEELSPERSLSTTPIFQVVFTLQNAPWLETRMKGLTVEPVWGDELRVRYDLEVGAWENEEQIEMYWLYNRRLFERWRIEQMGRHYLRVIESAIGDPEQQIGCIDLLGDEERRQILEEWNRTAREIPKATFPELFEEQVRKRPEAVAVVCEDQELTYGELNKRSNHLAHLLIAEGVGPEDVVALAAPRSLEMIIAALGVLKAGAAYLPIDPDYPAERVALLLADAKPALLLSARETSAILPDSSRRLILDPPDSAQALEPRPTTDPGDRDRIRPLRLQNPAYIIYTSGSTGKPKGVAVTHEGVSSLLAAQIHRFDISSESRILQFASLSFDASFFEIVMSLLSGATLSLLAPTERSGDRLAEAIYKNGVTHATLPPAVVASLTTDRPIRLDTLIVAGEACPPEVVARWSGTCRMINAYGPTETTVCATMSLPLSGIAAPPIGQPIWNTRAYVLDRSLRPTPVGVAGELYLAGAGLARGYLDRPALTAERFVADPYGQQGSRMYRTGDVARWRQDGNLEFLGRVDRQVKIRGFRIEPGEIEAALRDHPEVAQAVVVAREDRPGEKRLVGYVVRQLNEAEQNQFRTSQISEWRRFFDSTYADHARTLNDLNIVEVKSNYTGEPIAAEEMRIWVEETAARLRAFEPRRALDIGCGRGDLVMRLAGDCERYVGLDFSAEVLDRLKSYLSSREDLNHVELRQGLAHELSFVDDDSLDLVIINSVAQYFPDVEYLLEVLAEAARVTRRGGHIFVGDVRSLPLLEAYHTSAQLYKAAGKLSPKELWQRIRQNQQKEAELVVDARLFEEWGRRSDKVGRVETWLKGGGYDNELSRFRYDVVLQLGKKEVVIAPERWVRWDEDGRWQWVVQEALTLEPGAAIGVSGIRDRRVSGAVESLLALRSRTNEVKDVAHLQTICAEKSGEDPDAVMQLAELLGVKLNWQGFGAEGLYDVIFNPRWGEVERAEEAPRADYRQFVNAPSRGRDDGELGRLLQAYLQKRLPDYMLPAAIVELEALPLTPNGKLDRQALAEPEPIPTALWRAPRTPEEEILCMLFAEALGLERVGIDDDFFALGGHSLLATSLVSQIRAKLGVELAIRTLFESPSVAQLSPRLREAGVGRAPLVRRERPERLPLSYAQQRLWFIDQLAPGNAAYNCPVAVRLEGKLDFQVLEGVINEIVRRHESLRTRIEVVAGEPAQVIDEWKHRKLEIEDLTGLTGEEREEETRRIIREEAETGFDLRRGPLIRVKALKLGEKEHVSLLTTHHIVSDAWSMGVLVREVCTLYTALSEGRVAPLPELEIQYADYALWQREWLQGEALEQQLGYWKRQLDGAPAMLELPTDRPRPAVESYRGEQQSFALSAELTARLNELSLRQDATLFMTLLAVFQALLYRYSGQEDIVVGTSIANRNHREMEPLIGFLANTLVMRADLTGNPTFRQLLDRVSKVALDAFAHQDLPFEKLVEELRPERNLRHNPLFQVFFVLQNAPIGKLELPDLTLSSMEVESGAAMFDLMLSMTEMEGELTGILQYNCDLFDAATIRRMARRFRVLAESIVRNPDTAIADLQIDELAALPSVLPLVKTEMRIPASYHQERLWFIDQFEAGNVYESNPVYHNLPLILNLAGPVDCDLLEQSINAVIARHESLRTRIVNESGNLFQLVSSHDSLELKIVNVAIDVDGAPNDQAVDLALDETRHPFSLDRDLLVRASLFKTARAEFLLVIIAHHIIADRRSLQIIAAEVAEIYSARATGRPAQLPELPLQYPNYSEWQRQLSVDALEPLLFYWKSQLRGKLSALELPAQRPRPAVHTFTDARHAFSLKQTIVERIKILAQQARSTEFSILLACFKALLRRYARQDEIIVGISAPCRDQDGIKHVVGPFANLLALRSDLTGNPPFRSFLAQVNQTVAQAHKHQGMPFDRLVLELNPEKDMSRTALFDVLFHFDPEPSATLKLSDVNTRSIDTNIGYGKYDLSLSLRYAAGGLSGAVVYNADIYDHFMIEQMMRHYETLLETLTANPDHRLDDARLLNETEEYQQLVTWNATQSSYPVEKTIHQLVEEQAAKNPHHKAVICGAAYLTYRDLEERANQLAHYLRKQGAGRGTLIALCLDRSIEMIVALLGVLKAGDAYLPMDPEYPAERLGFMLEDAEVSYLITTQGLMNRIPTMVPSLILLDADRESIAAEPLTTPAHIASPHDIAYCIYTSGSTGKPKGVLVEHRNVVRLMVNDKFQFNITDHDVWTMFHSYCFDFSIWEMYGALFYGGALVIVPQEVAMDPALFLELLARERVTFLNQTPTAFYNLIKETFTRPRVDLALRYVVFGGEALNPIQLREWRDIYPEVKLINMYGITETTVHVTFKEITDREIQENLSNIGSPLPATTAYVMDSNLRLLPVGVSGEICVGGGGVSRGYLKRDELTQQKFVLNPYRAEERLYRSGDLAKLLPNGEMEYLGRVDDQIQIRGFRVEMGEIRSHLLRHPAVAEAVVIARQAQSYHLQSETQIIGYVAPKSEISGAALRNHLMQFIPHYMIPAAFVMLDVLPLTPNGKIDLKALPEPAHSRPEAPETLIAPRTPIEEIVVGIFKEALKLDRTGIRDNFFEIGGHSLLATQVVSRVRNSFGVEIGVRSIFEEPTVEGLARKIEEAMNGREQAEAPPFVRADRAGQRGVRLPLSFAQQRLWFLDQLAPNNPFYNCPGVAKLNGRLELEVLEDVINEIVRRHEVLRTRIEVEDGEPSQVIDAWEHRSLKVEDISSLAEVEKAAEASRITREEALTGFDLSRGPLLRVRVLKLGEEEHLVLYTMHHIVSDGWSMGILIREVGTLYQAYRAGKPSPLEELPIQYADFAVWQKQWLKGEALEKELEYWRKQLAGMETLELPTDHPRPTGPSARGAIQHLAVERELAEKLKQFSQREGVTLFMTMLGGFDVLMSRYSGRKDVAVGTDIANRNRVEIEGLIGFFVNQLVIRVEVSARESFSELLGRVREACLGAYSHQNVPFEKLVEELRPERDLGRSPLFQVKLGMQNLPREELKLEGLTLSIGDGEMTTTRLDLTVAIMDTGRDLVGIVEYSRDLFEEQTITRLVSHYTNVLREIALGSLRRDSEKPISEISLLNDREREQIVVEWNQTGRPYPNDRRVHELFAEQAERTPDRTALIGDGQEITYRELNRRANQLAAYLQRLGVGPETLVGLYLDRSVEMVVAMLGALKSGGAYLPLDSEYPLERLSFMLEDARVGIVVTDQELEARLPAFLGKTVLMDLEWERINRESDSEPKSETVAENLAYVIYTSGSTGAPKGVAVQHRALVARTTALLEAFELSSADRLLGLVSPSFDAFGEEVFTTLSCGAGLIIDRHAIHYSAQDLLGLIESLAITTLHSTIAYWHQLVDEVSSSQGRIPSQLRLCIAGGERTSISKLKQWAAMTGHQSRFINAYGPTEATITSTVYGTHMGSSRNSLQTGAPIGRPIANTQIYILDQNQQVTPIGVKGELYIGGAGVARGYLGRAEISAEKFVPDAFSEEPGERLYRTGDVGRYLEDGKIEFLGRVDDQVKLRGYRIELGEVESALNQHQSVRQCVVVAEENERGAKRLLGYVVGEEGSTAAELKRHLREKLPEYMIPQTILILDAMPVTPNGKIDRKRLLLLKDAETQLEPEYVAAQTPVEEILVGIFEESLKLDRVGIRDNFFEIGGHSLLATQVVSRVREIFGAEIEVRNIFEAPTAEALGRRIDEAIRAGEKQEAPPLIRVPRNGRLPLSFAQQRLWFIEQLKPGDAVYNCSAAVRLEGRLNLEALEGAINEIIKRHEVLRTRIEVEAAAPAQVIEGWEWRRLRVEDLMSLIPEEREKEARRIMREEAGRGFDLRRGPLMRVMALRLGEDQHILLFTMHHIVSDGWSMEVLVREMCVLYEAMSEGKGSPLKELEIQYADYAKWQREYLAGGVMENEIKYWKEQLKDAPIIELPTDHARPAEPSYRGGEVKVAIDKELIEGLRRLSQREGGTLFMALMAAFKVLLMRYSGEEDVSVGTAIANRTRREIEGLIGFFVNTLVMRTDLGGNPSFRELVKREREVALGAYARQEAPFEKLVEEINPNRDLSRSPLFQVMMVLQNTGRAEIDLRGLKVREIDDETKTAKFDLTLMLMEGREGIAGCLGYSHDLYEEETIRRMVRNYEKVVKEVVRDAEQRVREIDLMSAAEKEQVLVEFNRTERKFERAHFIHELIEMQAERRQGETAVVYEEEVVTYGELNARANQLAHHLRKLGVGPEALVGLCLERSVEMVVGLLGVLKAGGAYVPLDPSYPSERLSFMLEDAQVSVLLTQERLLPFLPAHVARVISLDRDWSDIGSESAENPEKWGGFANPAYVIYTSGSTGRPKGVVIAHGAIMNHMLWMQESFPLDERDRVLQKTPFSFDASVWEFYAPLLVGGQLIVARPGGHQDSAYLARLIIEREVTILQVVPSMLRILLGEPEIERCQSLRRVFCGGEVLTPDLRDQFFSRLSAELHNLYGPTEATIDATSWSCRRDEKSTREAVPIGRPVANVKAYVFDEWLEPTPVGVVGELYLGGAGVGRGYLRRPEMTAERFIPHRFSAEPGERLYRTGDLVRYLPDGNLGFLGRMDDQVKIRGYRIELAEIERVLEQEPWIQGAVVVVRAGALGRRQLVAYVVGDGERERETTRLRKYLKEKLPDYMVPSAIVVLERMPLTPNGKLDRDALPNPEQELRGGGTADVPPRTLVEEILAEIFKQSLNLDRIGIHDNFFELGGDSILSIQIVSKANEAGLGLTPKQLFQHQSIAELAAVVGQAGVIELEEGNVGGEVPLTPIQKQFFERDDEEPEHFNQAVMLEVKEYLDVELLRKVIGQLVKQHDILKHRFLKTEGGWRQVREEVDGGLALEEIDISTAGESLESEVIEEAAEKYQKGMNLEKGPLMRIVVFGVDQGRRQRVLIVAHHLIIDGVSWRILLGDFERGYEQAKSGKEINLGAKTTSYKRWAERLKEEAQSKRLREEAGYWLLGDGKGVRRLPTDRGGVNTMASSMDVITSLNEEETGWLLEKVHKTYKAQINEVLLSAVARSVSEWSREQAVLVEIDGHGREEIVEDVDLARTVGWFTSVYPVKLEVRSESNMELLQSVMEQIRKVSRRGIYYGIMKYLSEESDIREKLRALPQAEISFNYLGRLDLVLREGSLFRIAKERVGKTRSSKEKRQHLIEINGSVSGGRLHMVWSYSENAHRRETIAALAERTIEVLREVVAGCP